MAQTTWKGGSGVFNVATLWTAGVPGSGDQGFISGFSGAPLTVTVDATGSHDVVGSLALFDATLAVAGGTLVVGSISTGNDTLASPLAELSVSKGSLIIQQGSGIGSFSNTQVTGLIQTGGTVVFQNGSIESGLSILQGEQGGVQLGAAGTLEVDQGTLEVLGNSTFAGTLASAGGKAAGSSGLITLGGGAIYNLAAGVKLNVNEIALQDANSQLVVGASMTDQFRFAEFGGAAIQLSGNTLTFSFAADIGGVVDTTGTMVNVGSIDDSGMSLQNSVVFDNQSKGIVAQRNAITIGGAATLRNDIGATYNLLTDAGATIAGSGTFQNAGLFQKTTGAFSSVTSLFNNVGTVLVTNNAVLNFANNDSFGGTIAGTGLVQLSGGGSYTLNAGIVVTVGALHVSAANAVSELQLALLGSLTYGGAFSQDAGTNMLLTGTTKLTLTNAADTLGGTVTGSAATRMVLASTLAPLSDNNLILRGALTVEVTKGGLVNQGGTVTVGLLSGDSPTLQVDAGATYNFNAPSVITGVGTITDAGTFVQAGVVAGRSIVSTFFDSTGTVAANGGTLEFTGSDTFGGSIQGAGTIALSGAAFTLANTVAAPLSLTVNTLQVTNEFGAAQVTLLRSLADAHTFDQSFGTTLDLISNIAGTATVRTILQLSGLSSINGVISGVLNSELDWTKTAIASDGGMILTGAVTALDEGHVGQQGLVTVGLLPGDDTELLVAANADYDLTVVSQITGDGLIVNLGTFEQATGVTGTSVVATSMLSTATILSNGGNLEFTGGDTFAGTLGGAGTISLSGAFFNLDAGVVVSVGALDITSAVGTAEVAVLGNLTYAGSFQQTGNTTLSLANGIGLTLTGPNDVLNGTVLGAGGTGSQLTWAKSATGSDNGLSLTGAVVLLDNGAIGQLGTVTIGAQPGDTAQLQIAAGALYDLRVQSNITGSGRIINAGTFEQDVFVTGRSTVATNMTSTALVLATTGTLEFTGADSFAGTITGTGTVALSAANFTFQSGLIVTVSSLDISQNVGATNVAVLGTTFGYAGLFTEEANTTLSLAGGMTMTVTHANEALNGEINGAGPGGSTFVWGATATGSDAGMILAGNSTLEDFGHIGQIGTDTVGLGAGDNSCVLTIEVGALYNFSGPSLINGDGTVINSGVFGQGTGGTVNSTITARFTNESTGSVICDSGAVVFNGTDVFGGTISGGGSISFSDGSFTLQKGVVLNVSTLDLSGDIGPTLMTVDGNLVYGGKFLAANTSSVNIAAGVTLTLSGGNNVLAGTVSGQALSSLALGANGSASDDGLTVTGGMTLLDGGLVGQTGIVTIGPESGDATMLRIATGASYDLLNSATLNGYGTIINSGNLIKAGTPGTSFVAPSVVNVATAHVSDTSGVLIFGTAFRNNGTVGASTGGTIEFNGAVSANTGITGTVAIGTLGTMNFQNAVAPSQNIAFADMTGHMVLAAANLFAGTISGFAGTVSQSDTIDLTNVYKPNATFTYVSTSASAGVLDVTTSVGGLTTTLAQLHFSGSYTTASFKFATDASGNGTNITDPPMVAAVTPANTSVARFTFTNTGSAVQTAMLAPAGSGIEAIAGFALNGHDVLDLARVLAGASGPPTLANLGSYVTAAAAGGDTTLSYDATGHGHGAAFATLDGMTTTMAALLGHHAFSLG